MTLPSHTEGPFRIYFVQNRTIYHESPLQCSSLGKWLVMRTLSLIELAEQGYERPRFGMGIGARRLDLCQSVGIQGTN